MSILNCIGIDVSADHNILWMVFNNTECLAIDATEPEILDIAKDVEFPEKSSRMPTIYKKNEIKNMKRTKQRKLLAVFTTHHHLDHSKGDKQHRTNGIPVYNHDKIFHENRPSDELFDAKIEVNDFNINILHTPCHTQDSICILIDQWLFTGDTLFYLGCGRFFEGTAEQMSANFSKILSLPSDTICCYGHDYSKKDFLFAKQFFKDEMLKNYNNSLEEGSITLTIEQERNFNPFINCKKFGMTLQQMRDAKNNF
ncbi:Glyoxylase [Pseudoloma neurophilia]|uniref:hydroxyacylglutathione hydrolase n=1 Tax=Pseudoloma neurophilia TaxID=146866 RepID=A0A0R0LU37_9MICR|nr:Glyoxylase [Pseudoloma neurophilia]